ncbi:MAG: DUF2804 domain-containing protein [Acidimicrobiales bacterium]|nr:DUF2804 domain-containing protein [Acidimicrobiales bacterium]
MPPTSDPPQGPPPLTAPPAALVVDGRHQLGSFDAPVPVLNLGDVVRSRGWRGHLARVARDLRTKEWEAFQLGDDEWFVLGAVYDAKVVGIVMVIAVHQRSGRILRWIDKVPSNRVSVARGLEGTASVGRSRSGRLAITNAVGSGRVHVDGHHGGGSGLPPLRLSGTGDCSVPAARHLAVCHPFDDDHVLYTNKCLMPFVGELWIGSERVGFDADRSFLILDDHHGEYPSPQVYDWVTGAGRRDDGSLAGFNLTHNQVRDPDVHNENVVWVDGTLLRLPAVTFARPGGVLAPWHITDTAGTVDVTFTPTVDSTLHVGPRHALAEYHAPYGRFAGTIRADGRTVRVDGLFGMGERKRIRI